MSAAAATAASSAVGLALVAVSLASLQAYPTSYPSSEWFQALEEEEEVTVFLP